MSVIGRLDTRPALDAPELLTEPVRVALSVPGAEVVDGPGRAG